MPETIEQRENRLSRLAERQGMMMVEIQYKTKPPVYILEWLTGGKVYSGDGGVDIDRIERDLTSHLREMREHQFKARAIELIRAAGYVENEDGSLSPPREDIAA